MSEIAEAGDLYIYTVLVDGIYIKADADNKKVVRKEIVINLVKNEDKLCELGFTLCDEMPNVVPYSEEKGWLYFIVSAPLVGPMQPKCSKETEEMPTRVTARKIYVATYFECKTFKESF